MTPRQQQLLRFIERSIQETGLAPDYEEMRVELGLANKGGVHPVLTELEAQGRIIRRKGRRRGIELVPQIESSMLLAQIRTEALFAELRRRCVKVHIDE